MKYNLIEKITDRFKEFLTEKKGLKITHNMITEATNMIKNDLLTAQQISDRIEARNKIVIDLPKSVTNKTICTTIHNLIDKDEGKSLVLGYQKIENKTNDEHIMQKNKRARTTDRNHDHQKVIITLSNDQLNNGLYPKQTLFKNLSNLKKPNDSEMLKNITGWTFQKFIPMYARKDMKEHDKMSYEIRQKDKTRTTKIVLGKERPIILTKKKRTNKWTEINPTNTPKEIYEKYADYIPTYLINETTL